MSNSLIFTKLAGYFALDYQHNCALCMVSCWLTQDSDTLTLNDTCTLHNSCLITGCYNPYTWPLLIHLSNLVWFTLSIFIPGTKSSWWIIANAVIKIMAVHLLQFCNVCSLLKPFLLVITYQEHIVYEDFGSYPAFSSLKLEQDFK